MQFGLLEVALIYLKIVLSVVFQQWPLYSEDYTPMECFGRCSLCWWVRKFSLFPAITEYTLFMERVVHIQDVLQWFLYDRFGIAAGHGTSAHIF